MTESVDIAVRRWLLTHPGFHQAASERGVLETARRASGIVCAVEDFAAALDRAGFRVRQMTRLDGSTVHQLALPEKPGGVNRLPAGRTISGLRDARRGQV